MTKIRFISLLLIGLSVGVNAQKISPYYNCGQVEETIQSAKAKVVETLNAKGYAVTGEYDVANDVAMHVLCFSSEELQQTCLKVKDKGILASNLRIGFQTVGNKTELTIVNPKYIFLGYLRAGYDANKKVLDKIDKEVKSAMQGFTNQLTAFGGSLEESELKKYHYMAMMPYFDDPVELGEFISYEDALATIDKNLELKKGNTTRVYKLSFATSKMAVYGVGLLDKEMGEGHYLPIIGTKHFAAMPYEIVVMDNVAYMLHGRFRFAMFWPELKMSTFTKIMSTPGNVEGMLKGLTKNK